MIRLSVYKPRPSNGQLRYGHSFKLLVTSCFKKGGTKAQKVGYQYRKKSAYKSRTWEYLWAHEFYKVIKEADEGLHKQHKDNNRHNYASYGRVDECLGITSSF